MTRRGSPAGDAPLHFVRADVARSWSFLRRLFIEADALAFVELFELARHGTAMEEPLLPAVVTNEPESAIAHQSFNRPVGHVRLTSAGRAATTDVLSSRAEPGNDGTTTALLEAHQVSFRGRSQSGEAGHYCSKAGRHGWSG